MNRKTLLIIAVAVAVILLWPWADRSMLVYGQAKPEVTVEKISIPFPFYDYCANNEWLDLNFVWHQIFTFVPNANGGVHIKYHSSLSNFKGVGVDTGTKWQGNRTVNDTNTSFDSDTPPPWELTYIETFKGESQGSAANILLQVRKHITVNANGETTSSIDRVTSTCK